MHGVRQDIRVFGLIIDEIGTDIMKETCPYCGEVYGTRTPRGGCKNCLCRICGLPRKKTKADVEEYCECPLFRTATAIWFAKEGGREWCRDHIPTLYSMFGTAPICGIYVIELNGVPLYVGRAVDLTPRLIGHAYVLHTEPEYFGLNEIEVESDEHSLSVRLVEVCLPDDCSSKEVDAINRIRPVLQLGGNNDRCIPKARRRAVVLSMILDKA